MGLPRSQSQVKLTDSVRIRHRSPRRAAHRDRRLSLIGPGVQAFDSAFPASAAVRAITVAFSSSAAVKAPLSLTSTVYQKGIPSLSMVDKFALLPGFAGMDVVLERGREPLADQLDLRPTQRAGPCEARRR